MTTVVAMLRGINVSGRNKVPMADLRSTAESLGYTGVRSYVQSGNLVFDAPGRATPASVASRLGEAVLETFGVDVPVVVRTRDELIDMLWPDRYLSDSRTLDTHIHRLRSKLEPDPAEPRYIVTVRGVGFRIDPDGTPAGPVPREPEPERQRP